jgi:hypothetical protein
VNAPIDVPPPDTLLAEALDRLAEVSRRAGQPEWVPPFVPIAGDRLRQAIARAELGRGEALAVALLLAVECDASVARRVATVQAPVGGAAILAGLVASLFAPEGLSVAALWSGKASRAGLIVWGDEAAPLPERSLSVPPWLAAGLAGFLAPPPGVAEPSQPRVILPESVVGQARAEAAALRAAGDEGLLVVRASCPAEGEALASAVAAAAGLEPCRLAEAEAPGLAAWLAMMGRLPFVHRAAGPGEMVDITALDTLATPLVAILGPDGEIVSGRKREEWRARLPSEQERAELWRAWGLGSADAAAAAARNRQSAGRIAELGRGLAGGAATLERLAGVMKTRGGRIDALARRAHAEVRREDIVLPGELDAALDRLLDRILLRNRLHEGLGSTIAARYKPGVRALLTGESGTGKTLAVHWLASEAGLPLYRVDLAALTSKWIGETEKNLSQLLDAAEQGDVLLFFDEADSLFGARTDVSDAHDRYANSQTNFLLQRIEDYEGVALLATNSRDRFDPAFVRRLDMVLEFPLPDAAARRLLWERHLGDGHDLPEIQVDRIAAAIDLAGGHVRNIVLAAAARARAAGRRIGMADIAAAAAEEYAKLGRTAPLLPPAG